MPIDYKKYPKNWQSIRNEILTRAKNRCECAGECGAGISKALDVAAVLGLGHELVPPVLDFSPGGSNIVVVRCIEKHLQPPKTFKGRRVILTIAHTNKSRNPRYVNRSKLKAMCQPCHLRYDAPMKAQKRRLLK